MISPQTFNSSNITTECPDAECLFAFYGGETLYHKYLILLQFYNLFLFFWCVNFVTALGQVTLAGAFASYYWAFKKPDDIPAYPVFNSLGRALRCVAREYFPVDFHKFSKNPSCKNFCMLYLFSRYHAGTLAFGSLILAIVQIIRVILEYLDQKLKGLTALLFSLLFCFRGCAFRNYSDLLSKHFSPSIQEIVQKYLKFKLSQPIWFSSLVHRGDVLKKVWHFQFWMNYFFKMQ